MIIEQVKIPKFPTHVLTAKTRKPKYNKKGKCTNKNLLYKPKYSKINTNKLYSGYGSYHERITIVAGIKEAFRPKIQSQMNPVDQNPIKILMEIQDVKGKGEWDLDNKAWIYFKAFQDLLVEQGIIPDDSVTYVTGNEYLFSPVDHVDDRQMAFYLQSDER
jgi:hypothetical protein